MFIQLSQLGDEAIAALKKAQPMLGGNMYLKPEYNAAFQEFQRATDYKYLDGGTTAFDCAVLSYQRKKSFNPYKSVDGSDTIRKAIFVSETNKGFVEKEMLKGLDNYVIAKQRRAYETKIKA